MKTLNPLRYDINRFSIKAGLLIRANIIQFIILCVCSSVSNASNEDDYFYFNIHVMTKKRVLIRGAEVRLVGVLDLETISEQQKLSCQGKQMKLRRKPEIGDDSHFKFKYVKDYDCYRWKITITHPLADKAINREIDFGGDLLHYILDTSAEFKKELIYAWPSQVYFNEADIASTKLFSMRNDPFNDSSSLDISWNLFSVSANWIEIDGCPKIGAPCETQLISNENGIDIFLRRNNHDSKMFKEAKVILKGNYLNEENAKTDHIPEVSFTAYPTSTSKYEVMGRLLNGYGGIYRDASFISVKVGDSTFGGIKVDSEGLFKLKIPSIFADHKFEVEIVTLRPAGSIVCKSSETILGWNQRVQFFFINRSEKNDTLMCRT